MIEEAYVSFECAKLLKEKGFDEPCYQCYVLFDKFVETLYYEFAVNSKLIKFERLYADEQPLINSKGFRDLINNKDKSRVFAAPTLQMAMKWLREVHKVNIEIHYNRFGDNYKYLIIYKPEVLNDIRSLGVYYYYEEACEAAIQYSLKNLI